MNNEEEIQALTLLCVLEKMHRLEQDMKNCVVPEVKAGFYRVYKVLYSVYGEHYETMRPSLSLLQP